MTWPEAIAGSVVTIAFFGFMGWMLYLGFRG